MTAVVRASRLSVMTCALMLAVCVTVGLGSPAQASASTSAYCNNQTLSNYGACVGGARSLYQTYGWGDEHSVCVWYRTGGWGSSGNRCSSGPEVGVYSASTFETTWEPGINVNASGSSVVHGVALTH